MGDLPTTDLKIMEYIRNKNGAYISQINDEFLSDCLERLEQLHDKKYIERDIENIETTRNEVGEIVTSRPHYSGRLCLTESGMAKLQDYHLELKERKRDKRHDWNVNLVSALVGAIVGALFGAVVGGLVANWATLATLGLK